MGIRTLNPRSRRPAARSFLFLLDALDAVHVDIGIFCCRPFPLTPLNVAKILDGIDVFKAIDEANDACFIVRDNRILAEPVATIVSIVCLGTSNSSRRVRTPTYSRAMKLGASRPIAKLSVVANQAAV
jgi:hypothetical protein